MDNTKTTSRADQKKRWLYFALALSVIPIGLIARSFRGDADATTAAGFIATYLGDTLWAVMFFYVFAALAPHLRTHTLALVTLVITLSIEASQLYQGEPLASLRGFAPTRFLLGTNFLWSDVICLIIGTTLASALHLVLVRRKASAEH